MFVYISDLTKPFWWGSSQTRCQLVLPPPPVEVQQVEWKTPPTLAPFPASWLYSATAFSVCSTVTSTPLCFTNSSVAAGTWWKQQELSVRPWTLKVNYASRRGRLTCRASLMPLPMTSVSIPFFSTSSRSAGWTPGRCCGPNSHLKLLYWFWVFFSCMSVETVLGSTHVGPGLSPVPGSAASRPNLTVLIAAGASFHLHVAPGERGDLGRRHVGVTPPAEKTNKQTKKKQAAKIMRQLALAKSSPTTMPV